MAKKTTQTGNYDLDKDLDLGQFDFDIDSQINPAVNNRKSRSPITDVFKGTIKGAGTRIKDPSFIKKVIKDSLPPNYEYMANETDKGLESMSRLYNDASREIKPQLQRMAGRVDRLVPEEQRLLKKMSKKFKDLVGVDYEPSASGPNLQEQAIANAMAQVFSAQNQSDNDHRAKQAAEDKIQEQIESKRFKTNFGLLSSINDSLQRVTAYQDKITLSYQKKSLEIQYRSFFVQTELLEQTKKFNAIFEKQNEAVIKNTALPEFVKATNTERFKEIARNSLFGNMQKTFTERVSAKVKEQIEGFKTGLANSEMLLDGIEQMVEMQGMMGDKQSAKFTIGEFIGANLVDALSGKISGPLKAALAKNKGVMKAGNKGAAAMMNASGELKRYIEDNDIVMKSYGFGPEALQARAILTISDLLSKDKSNKIKTATNLGELNEPYYITRKAITSLTDVIPGFLSRIHYEVSASRVGPKNAKLLTYDYQSGKFRTTKEITGLAMKVVDEKISKAGNLKSTTEDSYKYFTGNQKVDPSVELELKKFMIDISQEDIVFDKRGITGSKGYKGLSKEAKSTVDKNLDQMFSGDNDDQSKLDLTTKFKKIQSSLPDISEDIKKMVDAGYGPTLEKEGLITINDDGSHEINMKKYRELMMKNNIAVSDENKKRSIKDYNPKDALKAIKKTKVYSWFFKDGKGPSGQKLGPMAQDVNQNIGEDAAPGGVSLDMTTMNGTNMAAIQALAEQQEQQAKDPRSIKVLVGIRKDTSGILKLLSKGHVSVGGSGGKGIGDSKGKDGYADNLKTLVGASIDMGSRAASDMVSATRSVIGATKDKILTPGAKAIVDFYNNNKDKVINGAQLLYGKAVEVSSSVFDSAKNLINNQLPKGLQFAKNKFNEVKKIISDMVTGPINVYIKGSTEPVLLHTLMRAGQYIDSGTNKVIESVNDIRNAKGDIVDRTGKVVLSLNQIAQGILDDKGREIKTAGAKAARAAIAGSLMLYRKMKTGFKKFADSAKNLGKGFKGKFGLLSLKDLKGEFTSMFDEMQIGFSSKTYEVLTEIRDIIKDKFGDNKPSNTIGKKGFRVAVKPSESSSEETTTTTTTETKGSGESGASGGGLLGGVKGFLSKGKGFLGGMKGKGLKGIIGGLGSMLGSKSEEGDESNKETKTTTTKVTKPSEGEQPHQSEGSGERKGNWKDRLDSLKNKAKTKFASANLNAKYLSDKSPLSGLMDKASGLFDLMGNGLGKVFGKGGVLSKVGGLLSNIGTKGKGLISGASRLAGLSGGAMGTAGRVAMAAGRVAMVGASLGASAIGTAITAIGGGLLTVISSPVVLGAAAVAALGYGAYKLYKYFKGNANDFDKLRIYQYGLTMDASHEAHHREIIALETYLDETALVFNQGKEPSLNEKKIDMKEMLAIFSIDEGDSEAVQNFGTWFSKRFKPFFLTNIAALFAANPKCKLQEIRTGLTLDEQIKYLSTMSYESGPYSETTSPFKDIPYLNNDKSVAVNAIKNMTDKLGKQKMDKSNKDKQGDNRDKKAVPPPAPTVTSPKPVDTNAGTPKNPDKTETGKIGEGDGKQPTAAPGMDTGKTYKIDKLKIASGPLSDGSDADKYLKLGNGVNISNLNPEVYKNLRGMIQEYGELTGKTVGINDGFRSRQQQEMLYRKNPGAAKPGGSLHEFGMAIDIDRSILNEMEDAGLMRKYGFTRPVGQEPWHMEPAGIQGSIDAVKRNTDLALKLVANSPGKGGGGLGTIANAPKYKRDNDLAIKTMEANDSTVNANGRPKLTLAVDNTKGNVSVSESLSKNENLVEGPKRSNARGGSYGGSVNTTTQTASSSSSQGPTDAHTAIEEAAKQTGADGGMMKAFAQIESGMNPNAKAGTSSASGLFQFTNATWKEQIGKHGSKYGLDPNASPNDPMASSLMAGEYLKTNMNGLKKVKDNPDIVDLYLSHFLGLGGAKKFLSADPSAIGADVLPDAARSNRNIFYDGNRPRTLAEIRQVISNKVSGAASKYGVDVSQQALQKAQSPSLTATANSSQSTAPVSASPAKTEVRKPVRLVSDQTNTAISQSSNTGTGQNLGQDIISSGLNTVNDTMLQSLGVQKEMLDVLKNIFDRVNPENLQAFKDSLTSKPDEGFTNSRPREVPKSGIDLRRKTA